MFALRVGKNSCALNDNELRGFFEACDDVDDKASDSDDDLDDDSGSESDEEAATEFPPVPICVHCPFCADGSESTPFTGAAGVARHLRTVHQLAFRTMSNMVLLLQRYLDAWAARLKDTPVDEVATREADSDGGAAVYCVDAAVDQEIREQVQREGLQAVLETQDAERHSVAREARKCLFCKRICEDRADLFRHAFREHSFNIGRPDNLVNANEFLAILEAKLAAQQCPYCEKTFTSAAVLRRHMRKKKHFKISSHNRLYDRFYVVNYLEPGRSWEAIDDENKAESDDAKDESWTDWDERADLPTQSLFDDRVLPSADDCWAYMRTEFGFDIARIRADHGLDFYQTVSLVNAIRRSTASRACFACGQSFADGAALADHIRQADTAHLVPPPRDSAFWDDSPAPVVENDPLLMTLDDDDEDSDGDGKAEAATRALRKKLGAVALDSTSDPAGAAASAQ
ncbi:hypothetical protein H4R19_004420 [Coemansia spiralis]|nr:hypothetical protein H4R19_004420 [Coemansia spiralis]